MLESMGIFMPEIFLRKTAWFSRLYKFGPRCLGSSRYGVSGAMKKQPAKGRGSAINLCIFLHFSFFTDRIVFAILRSLPRLAIDHVSRGRS